MYADILRRNDEVTLAMHGKSIISQFEACIILRSSHRQACLEFTHALDRLAKGESTLHDYELFKSRYCTELQDDEVSSFKDAIKLFPKRIDVESHNMTVIENLVDESKDHVPVARIPAKSSCAEASKASSEKAEGLEAQLHLSKGCKVTLRSNLWTEKGLVNGSIGNVDILYEDGMSPPDFPPAVILCYFPSYAGPALVSNCSCNVVPIPPITRTWTSSTGMSCARTQFPLQLCYAVSIHKSQGLTLEKVFN